MAFYSRKNCEQFVRMVLNMGEPTFVRLWIHASGLVLRHNSTLDALALDRPPIDVVVTEWENLSPWDKQGVLFFMIPHIERIASNVAMAESRRARELDPL